MAFLYAVLIERTRYIAGGASDAREIVGKISDIGLKTQRRVKKNRFAVVADGIYGLAVFNGSVRRLSGLLTVAAFPAKETARRVRSVLRYFII